MSKRVSASTYVRLAMIIALFATIGWQGMFRPAQGAQQTAEPATHQDGPQVSFLFGSGSVTGGREITLRVKLTGPAPSGGAAVVLNSEDDSIIPLPATVTVPAGQTEHTFSADTNPVTVDIHVRVSAGYGGATKGREVFVKAPDLRSLSVQSVIRGGGQGKITLCLTGIAPADGVEVNLASMTTPAGVIEPTLDVPPTITIPAGKACLSIAVDAAEVEEDTPVTVTASYQGVNLSQDTIVRDFAGPPPPTSTPTNTATATETATEIATATATATTVPTTFMLERVGSGPVEVGGSVDFNVCINAAPDSDLTVFLVVNNPSRAVRSPATLTYTTSGPLCQTGTLTDRTGVGSNPGNARLEVFDAPPLMGGMELAHSEDVLFPEDPATATPTDTAVPTATNTEVPTATATDIAVPSTGMFTLTRNEADGFGNGFDVAGSGFLPNSNVTISGLTNTNYAWDDVVTTDASGNFTRTGYAWPCGGEYGTLNSMTASDGVNSATLDQPILC